MSFQFPNINNLTGKSVDFKDIDKVVVPKPDYALSVNVIVKSVAARGRQLNF